MRAKPHRHDLTIDVAQPCHDWRRALPGAPTLCRSAARAAFAACKLSLTGAELSVVLADDALVRGLNKAWRGKDAPTNVLSFPAQEFGGDARCLVVSGMPVPLGDVVLGFETIRREAAEQGKTLDDHLVHLVVHGVLHLLGFDHAEEPEAERMEALERAVLSQLGVADPYETHETRVPVAVVGHG